MNRASTSLAARPLRIPLFARVNAAGTTMYAWNISDGGLYLKAPGALAEEIPIGRSMALSFDLPDGGPAIEVLARVVWVDHAVRDHRGRSGLGLGMRFDELPGEFSARIRGFVQSFRYGVALFGFSEPELAERAFGDLFRIEDAVDQAALGEMNRTGHVGFVLIGEGRGRRAAMSALRGLVERQDIERQPPVLYAAHAAGQEREAVVDEELEKLVASFGSVAYASMPLGRLELRSHARRAVEGHVLAFENDLLTTELGRAFERLRRENEYLRSRSHGSDRLEEIVGASEAIRKVHDMIERIAPFDTGVVIIGETGTGKELVSRAIHRLSGRSGRPFIAQNCAALTETLLDSELFGHSRGAFTGATGDRVGLFEAADGGTVFLDEIGEMTSAMQAKLLRVLQEGEVKRVGETHHRRVDIRVICATNRDLEQMVREGGFREDLYYRLRSFALVLPPLRDRREDVPLLALHFLGRLGARHGRRGSSFTSEAMQVLQAHSWPGNARELEYTVERLLVLCPEESRIGADLAREALGVDPGRAPRACDRGERSLERALADYERDIVTEELERTGGVIARAARELGVERSTLSRRLRQLGIKTS